MLDNWVTVTRLCVDYHSVHKCIDVCVVSPQLYCDVIACRANHICCSCWCVVIPLHWWCYKPDRKEPLAVHIHVWSLKLQQHKFTANVDACSWFKLTCQPQLCSVIDVVPIYIPLHTDMYSDCWTATAYYHQHFDDVSTSPLHLSIASLSVRMSCTLPVYNYRLAIRWKMLAS